MPSTREEFWNFGTYAVIGDSQGRRKFPTITYENLKKLGKTVYAVDPGSGAPVGEPVYPSLDALPAPVEAAVLEVDKPETTTWVERVAHHGISNLWIHQQTDTPEALNLAKERGLCTEHGHCAVMYTFPGFSCHSFHRWIVKLSGKF